MASSPVAEGEVFAGKYRVEGVLGEGGMGVVVRAHHLELDQPVAVKFLLGDLATAPEAAERFRREARAAAKIQSDHVVRVLDVGVLDGGQRYMVMEFLDGRDLSEVLRDVGALPVQLACEYMRQAVDAVAHAHAVGIVHRDLKPANLFLARRPDGRSRVKVLDFGISKSLGTPTGEGLTLTRTSAWIGSPLYMSPEQMQSARDVDERTDVWSLGAIFYELLTGEPPYVAESLPQLCSLLLTRDAEPLEARCPEVPPALARAIMGCLVRERSERVTSLDDLSDAIAAALDGLPSARGSLGPRSVGTLAATELGGPPPAFSTSRGGGASPAAPSSVSAATGGVRDAGTLSETAGAFGSTERSPRPGRGLGLVAGAALLALAAGLAFWLLGAPEAAPPGTPVVAEQPAAVQPPAVAAQPAATALPAPPAATEPDVAAAPAASAAPQPAPTSAARPRPSTRSSQPASSAAPPAPADGVSDFGGRR